MSEDVTVSLDLGCGAKPKNFFGASVLYGVDIRNDLDNNVVKAGFGDPAYSIQRQCL